MCGPSLLLRSLLKRLTVIALISLLHPVGPVEATDVPESTYVPRTQIVIEGNSDLTPANGVVGGTGSANDPYLITGWVIYGPGPDLTDGAIRIANVTKHLLVHDNLLSSPVPGLSGHGCSVLIDRSSNVSFTNNRFVQTVRGICAIESRYISVENNDFASQNTNSLNVAINAVAFKSVDDSVIRNNSISSFFGGIVLLDGADRNLVENNVLVGNGRAGAINIAFASTDNRVIKNRISHDAGTAIQVFSSNNHVGENNITSVSIGIWVGDYPDRMPENVTVSDNTVHGAHLALRLFCGSCTIQYNRIEDAQRLLSGDGSTGQHLLQYNLFKDHKDIVDQKFQARNNSFQSTGYTIYTGNITDLRFNWWGDPSGPAPGTIEGTTKFEPWLTTPPEHVGPRS